MSTTSTVLGRRPKLSRRITKRLVFALEAGNYTTVAVGYAGIGRATFYRWMHRGRETDGGIYRDFYVAVRRALAIAEARAVAIIRRHMAKSWRACLAWLERRHRDRWGVPRREDVEFRPHKVLCDLLNMTEDELYGLT
ncbi:MAG: hypothetical protein AAF657_25825 [Acidobacteriota bacterium]